MIIYKKNFNNKAKKVFLCTKHKYKKCKLGKKAQLTVGLGNINCIIKASKSKNILNQNVRSIIYLSILKVYKI